MTAIRYCAMMGTMRCGSEYGSALRLTMLGTLLGVVMFTGCSANQTIMLQEDGSGTALVEIALDPIFEAYLTDLTASFGGDESAVLFDMEAIRRSIAAQPGLSLTGLEAPSRSTLRLDLAFDSVDSLLRYQGRQMGLYLRFERTESFRRLAARIDREAIDHFVRIAGIDPFVRDSLMPPPDVTSAVEYRDYLAWALEEYRQDRGLDVVFRESRVVTVIFPAGSVVQVRGGEVNDDGVRFVTPLIEAVTTPEPFVYSLVFSP